jgi:hypothetical protein
MNTLAQVLAHKQDYENAERLCRRACQLRSDVGVAGRYEEGRQTELRALALVNVETHPDELLRAAILRNVGNAAAGGARSKMRSATSPSPSSVSSTFRLNNVVLNNVVGSRR